MALPRGAMGLSAVCDCGISGSYSLTIIDYFDVFVENCNAIWYSLLKLLKSRGFAALYICNAMSYTTFS